MRITITGHRPHLLGGWADSNPNIEKIETAFSRMVDFIKREKHDVLVNSGMALGVDQWLAAWCVGQGIPFETWVPCREQDNPWPPASRRRYNWLLWKCAAKHMVSTLPYNHGCMDRRNKAMVDNCDVVFAVFTGAPGGTDRCIKYARAKGVPVVQYNPLTGEWSGVPEFRDWLIQDRKSVV